MRALSLQITIVFLLTCWLTGCGDSAATPVHPLESAAKPQRAISATQTANPLTAYRSFVAANFAGDAACQSCHTAEYDAHQRSGHSHTATLMTNSSLADRLLKMQQYDDPRRSQTFQFRRSQQQFLVRTTSGATADQGNPELPVTWLLGSGNHAQTPVAVDETHQVGVEMRFSYLAPGDSIGVTPDQDRFDDFRSGTIECFGRPMDKSDVLSCLGCHMTLGPPPGAPWLREFFVANVGCERCHGPRQKHVELAKLGRAAESKPLINYHDSTAYVTACAACHRDETSIRPESKPHEQVRFQPFGLKNSRCYQRTPGNMSCAVCHDPHDAASSSDRPTYIAQCRSCHQTHEVAPCPSTPGGDCIDCHMPAVEWTAGIKFHDHWIRQPKDFPYDRGP